jgi:hypothetical protein
VVVVSCFLLFYAGYTRKRGGMCYTIKM